MKQKKYTEFGDLCTRKCPVCGNLSFPDYEDSFVICPVCSWTDHQYQNENPDEDLLENRMSLNQAREAWKNGQPIR